MALWIAGSGISLSGQSPKPAAATLPLLPAVQAWMVTLAAPPIAPGTMDLERVYVPVGPRVSEGVPEAGTEQIVALERETGERCWSRALRSEWPPVVADGVVYVATSDALHALDADSGLDRWRAPLSGPPAAAPVVAGTLLITATPADGLVAFSTADARQVWSRSLDLAMGQAAIAIHANAVYASLGGGRLVKASLSDGSLTWDKTVGGTLTVPAAARDRVLVGSNDNHLYALDPDDGDVEWRYPAGGDVVGAAAAGELVYFVARDNVLRALDRGSGNQRWKSLIETRAAAPPRVAGGVVIVPGQRSPALMTFDARTGASLGMYEAPSDLVGPALVDTDLRPFAVAIVAITGDGRVIGLRPEQMLFREAAPAPFSVLPGMALGIESASWLRP